MALVQCEAADEDRWPTIDGVLVAVKTPVAEIELVAVMPVVPVAAAVEPPLLIVPLRATEAVPGTPTAPIPSSPFPPDDNGFQSDALSYRTPLMITPSPDSSRFRCVSSHVSATLRR